MPAILGPGSVSLETCASDAHRCTPIRGGTASPAKQAARQPASQPGTTLARASEASKQATASQPDGQAVRNFWGGSSSHGKSN